MKTRVIFACLILAGFAQAQIIRVGQSTNLNGIAGRFGAYGQVRTQLGEYAFSKPEDGPINILSLPSGSLSGIDARCMAGTYANEGNLNISGFQQCTDNSGNIQFFSFDLGANATLIFSQIPETEAVAGYFDNFQLKDTGFIATPVFDQNGKVLKYNTTNFTVPGAASTNLMVANQYGIGGSFENGPNTWEGFLQRTNGPLEMFSFPGATNVAITALSQGCVAGYFLLAEGNQHGFFRCQGDTIPLDIGIGGTWITQITDANTLVGYAQDFQGNNFGFVWEGLTKDIGKVLQIPPTKKDDP